MKTEKASNKASEMTQYKEQPDDIREREREKLNIRMRNNTKNTTTNANDRTFGMTQNENQMKHATKINDKIKQK